MKAYLQLLRHILDTGVEREDRTGIGTLSVFGYQLRIDLNEGFPLLTTKKVYWKGVVHELLWFIRGDTNIRYLVQNGVHIWDEWPFQRYLEANGLEDEYPKYSEKSLGRFGSRLRPSMATVAGSGWIYNRPAAPGHPPHSQTATLPANSR